MRKVEFKLVTLDEDITQSIVNIVSIVEFVSGDWATRYPNAKFFYFSLFNLFVQTLRHARQTLIVQTVKILRRSGSEIRI